MGQAFKADIQIVQVRTDSYDRGAPRLEYWAAAAAPEQALMLVLAAIPDGWTVSLSDLTLDDLSRLTPGEVRQFGKTSSLRG